MLRPIVPTAVMFGILTAGTALLQAQQLDDQFFTILDSNGSGEIEPEEWGRLPAIRDFALSRNMPFDRNYSEEDFSRIREEYTESIREQVREQLAEREAADAPAPDVSSPAPAAVVAIPVSLSGSKAVRAPARTRPAIVQTLPEAYSAYDRNRDGQIALYEWSRSDIPAFQKLDRNGDGFITPAELALPAAVSVALPPPAAVTAMSPGPRPGPQMGPFGRPFGDAQNGDRRSDRGWGRTGRSFSGSPGDVTGRAEMTFNFLDSNKDGSISAEEFQRSRTVRPMFERAKIDISRTMSKQEFVENFAKANTSN